MQTLAVEVTVARPCLVGFQAVQEKSKRDEGWDGLISRWSRTFFLQPGKNELRTSLEDPSGNGYGLNPKKYGKVTALEINFYAPHSTETICVDKLRLLREKTLPPPKTARFKVLGTDL